ncbi:hypothetical protein [Caulobacter sp. LjRoot300]|uniref:hypothetical protein n=1 Tax=Caulobacter sp. LjRoot300 TaxID=3342321 RepID=UPI003ECEA88B
MSIWIAVVLFSLIALPSFVQLARIAMPEARPQVAVSILIGVAILAYKAIALARLSRWPILLHVASVGWSLVSRHLAHLEWRERFPILGPFVVLIPLTIYLALTLPHWRKMNWALLGRPYRPVENQAEIFA